MPTPIDRDEVRRLLAEEEAQLVEVLPPAEYEDEHLPGAINIPLKALDAETVRQLKRDRPVIVTPSEVPGRAHDPRRPDSIRHAIPCCAPDVEVVSRGAERLRRILSLRRARLSLRRFAIAGRRFAYEPRERAPRSREPVFFRKTLGHDEGIDPRVDTKRVHAARNRVR